MKILLADDHGIMRAGLRSLIDNLDGMQVVGEAANGRETVRLCRSLKPDIIIMDISMPDLNGIEAARQILAENPAVKVIALSMHTNRKFVAEMLAAGASGYVLKHTAFDELQKAVQAVAGGHTYLSPKIADVVVQDYRDLMASKPSSSLPSLTGREREVLQLIAEGQSTRKIAKILCVSISTVETHRRQIMNKLGLKSTAELTKYALREGLTQLEN